MGRVFACTDLHGRKDLFDKINAILEEDDEVIFSNLKSFASAPVVVIIAAILSLVASAKVNSTFKKYSKNSFYDISSKRFERRTD